MYGDEVMRLRREVASLKKVLGERVAPDNSDLFGTGRGVGGKELESLQSEHATLMRRMDMDSRRQKIREQAMRELERCEDHDNQRRPVRPMPGAGNKPRRNNSDLFVDEETFRRTGGM